MPLQAPRVSIITRTKDRPVLLRRAVASVLSQEFDSWQMIIVNDGGDPDPVDRLLARVKSRAAGRITVVHTPQSRGMEAASNTGLAAASGDYIAIHDDDDSWEPSFLQTTVGYLDASDASVGGVVTRSSRVVERLEGRTVRVERVEPYTPNLSTITLIAMARGNLFPPIAFLYRRSALDVIGRYREDLPVLGDWEFNLRFLSVFEIDVIRETLANYHHRPDTRTGIYSNTIVGGVDLHTRYDARLRNELLRADLARNQAGLGLLVNVARLCNDLAWELHRHLATPVENVLSRLRASGIRRFAVYGAGELGRRIASVAPGRGFRIDRIVDRNPQLWGTEIEGVKVVGLDQALAEGCRTFVIASLTFAEDMRNALHRTSRDRGIKARVFELASAA